MPDAPLQPDYAASWDFLQRFHPGRLIVVTGISLDKKSIPTETFGPDDRARFLKWVVACAAIPANIYFSVGEPLKPVTKKMERADILAVHYLHVDVDPRAGEDHAAERERILSMLRNPPGGLPAPTLIVFSGGGYQAYWRLTEPLPVNGDEATAEDLKRYNLQIERVLGGDNCHDISRIMRIPGTVNVPDAKKEKKGRVAALAEVVEWHDDRAYPIGQFVKAPLVQSSPNGGDGPAPKITAPGNVRQFAHVDELGDAVSDSVKVCIVNGCDPANPDHFPSRSEALFWVVCELVRAGVDDETIYAVLMNRDWRISDSVTEKGSGAQRYALRQIERAKEDAIDPSLRELNDRHAVIENIGGKCMVIEEVWSPVLKRPVMEVQGFDHFRNRYMNRTVNLGEKKDKKGNVIGDIEMPVGEWWLRNEKRRQYRSIVFMPNGDAAGSYNLWQGFGCEARPGDWSLFREHIRAIVCAGHDEHFAYLLGWMANAVQNPAEPGHTVPVLRGPQGCGKSIFGHHFGRVFGRHYFYATKPEDVLGKFNSHLRETVFLFADEAFFAGDPRNARQLKALVTDPYLTIELKGVNKEQAQNCLHCIMAGNDDWIVQADKDDRRYFVLDALGTHTNDHAYFGRIAQQMKQGGYEAMLHELLTMDLTRFNVRAKPDTAGLQRQKNYSMDPESRWVLHLLRDGLPDSALHNGTPDVAYPGDRDDGKRAGLFTHARKSIPDLRDVSDVRFADVLKEWGVTSKRYPEGKRYRFPPLPELRAKFDAKWGGQDWPGGADAAWGWMDEPLPEYPRDDDGRPF